MSGEGLAQLIGNVGAFGFVVWLAYTMTTKTIPDLVEQFRKANQQQRADFQEALTTQRSDFEAHVSREREFFFAETEKLVKVVTELAQQVKHCPKAQDSIDA